MPRVPGEAIKKPRKKPEFGALALVRTNGDGSMNRVESPQFKGRAEAWKWLKANIDYPGVYTLVRFVDSRALVSVTTPRMVLEQAALPFDSKE